MSVYLINCCDKDVKANIHKEDPQISNKTEATCVLQTELLSRNSNLTKKCTSSTFTMDVDFSDNIVKMVLLNGLADEDIKREILGTDNLDTKDLNTVLGLIETKECATRSLIGAAASTGL